MKLGQNRAAAVLSLFTSSSTLICCALPALLVSLGAGAALSSMVAAVPELIWFSEHKAQVFGGAGVMLVLAGALQWRARSLPCPLDPALAAACAATRRSALHLYLLSLALFLVGCLFAFVLPLL